MSATAKTNRRAAAALRHALLRGTAITLCAAAAPAFGQATLPAVSNAGGATVVSDANAGTMSVDANGANRTVLYDSFVLGTSGAATQPTLTFKNAAGGGAFTIVNKVTAGNGSKIFGTINAIDSVKVWLVDPAGITFGSSGTFSGNSLVLSTLDFANADLAAPQFAGASTEAVQIASGSSLTANTGSLFALAQKVQSAGTLTASSGAVVLVATQDVTFSDIVGSPLNFTINAGSTLTGNIIDVSGQLSAGNIALAGGALTAALLNVNQDASLTATANNGTIVLATATNADTSIIVNGNAAAISASGTLSATGADANVMVASATIATVDNDVTATGYFRVTGGTGVVLGKDNATVTQSAGTDVTITATANDIVGKGALKLLSSQTDATKALTLNAAGKVDFALTTSLSGGKTGALADVIVSGGTSIALGSVSGKSLSTTGGVLTTAGDIILGNVAVTNPLTITTNGNIRVGAATSAGNISLTSNNGDVSGLVRGTAATDGRLLTGYDRADLTATATGKTVTVSAVQGTAQLGTVTAGVDDGTALGANQIKVTAGQVDVAAATAFNGNISFQAITGVARAGALNAGVLKADGSVKAAGNVVVDSTNSTATVYGNVTAAGNYSVLATNAVTLGQNAAIVQSATGAVSISSDLGAINGLGSLTLQSNSDGAGAESLTVNATQGNIAFAPSTTVLAGKVIGDSTVRSDLRVGVDPGTGTLALGTIIARRLVSVGDATKARVPGAVTLGSTTLDKALDLATTNGGISTLDVTIKDAGESMRLSAGGAASDLTATGALTTNAADILLTAGRNISLTVNPNTGSASLALYAGGTVIAGFGLSAAEDVAIKTGGDLTLVSVTAGDDIDINTGGSLFVNALGSTGAGPDARAISFAPPAGSPTAIGVNAAAPDGHNIRVTAGGSVGSGPILSGPGLTVGSLFAGKLTPTDFTATADTGDIHIGSATSTLGNVLITATKGSVSGLSDAGIPNSGVAVSAPGAVTMNAAAIELSTVSAGVLDLTAGAVLRVTDATVGNQATLHTTSGPASTSQPNVTPLIPGFGRANLTASAADKKVTVFAFDAAQLGALTAGVGNTDIGGDQIKVTAGQIDVSSANAFNGNVYLSGTTTGLTRAGGLKARSDAADAGGGDVFVTTLGSAVIDGNVAANRDYLVTAGKGVTLGTTAPADVNNPITQTARGAVTITATTGNITGFGLAAPANLKLTANRDGVVQNSAVSAENLTLDAQAGNIAFDSRSEVLAGLATGDATNRSDLLVRTDPNTGSIALGKVTARRMFSIAETIKVREHGPVTLGDVTLDKALDLATTDGFITTRDVTIKDKGESLKLSAGGINSDLTTLALQTNANAPLADIYLTAGRDISFASVTTFNDPLSDPTNGTIALFAGRAVTGSGAISAGEDAYIRATEDISAASITAGDDINIKTDGSLYRASLTLTEIGPDARAASFGATAGDPAAITIAGAVGDKHNIIVEVGGGIGTGPRPSPGPDPDLGLVVVDLRTGSLDATAQTGDVRLKSVTATMGNISVDAKLGSVSGLPNSGVRTNGLVITTQTGHVDLSGSSIEVASVKAGDLTLAAGDLLRVTSGNVTGASAFSTATGVTKGFNGGQMPPLPGYGRSDLTAETANKTITVVAAGAAQLGTLTAGAGNGDINADRTKDADQIKVTAAEIDLNAATALNGNIRLTGTGAETGVTRAGLLKAREAAKDAGSGDVVVTTTGKAVIDGTVAANRDYKVTAGNGVTLGTAATAVAQSARGAVTITAAKGDILGLGALALTANSDGVVQDKTASFEDLTLDAQAGNINFDPSSFVLAGLNTGDATNRSDLRVKVGGADHSLTLGTIVARQFGSIADVTKLDVPGNVTLGETKLDKALDLATANGSITTHTAALGITINDDGESLKLSAGGTKGNIATGPLTTHKGDILLTAAHDVSLASVTTVNPADATSTFGTIGILAGDSVSVTGAVSAGEDVFVKAGKAVTLNTIVNGDDVDIKAGGAFFANSIETAETGGDLRAVSADTTQAGRRGSITIAAATGDGRNIRIVAGSVDGGPPRDGSDDQNPIPGKPFTGGLVVGTLTSGQGISLTAAAGDIRVGDATATTQNIVLNAKGSVSGLADGFAAATKGGLNIKTAGNVSFDTAGSIDLGVVNARGNLLTGSTASSIHIREIGMLQNYRPATVSLKADTVLRIDTAKVAGTTNLQTVGGGIADFQTASLPLVPGFGAANLTAKASKALITVDAGGSAQLNALTAGATAPSKLSATQIGVTAAAIDVATADARDGAVSLRARTGLINLGTGTAYTDLKANAAGDVTIGSGDASTGSILILAGQNILNTATLTAGEDVFATAGQNATFGALSPTAPTGAVTAVDNIKLEAVNGILAVVKAATSGGGLNDVAPAFDLTKVGIDDAALALVSRAIPPVTDGDIDLKAKLNVRLGQAGNGVVSDIGNITVEAVTGDVSGLAIGSTTDGRLLPAFGRADLTAKWADKTITLSAIGASGNVQLGALKAGADKSTLDNKAPDQINVTARAIDITSADAVNGRLVLTAADRRLFLGTGSAGTFAELIKRNDDGATVDGEDLLRVDTISGGLRTDTDATILRGVSLRSAVDVNVTTSATAERGDLKINAGRDLSIVTGATNTATATTGSILLIAGRDIVRADSLGAAEDVFGNAGGNATFGTVNAVDNIKLEAVTKTLLLTKGVTTGGGLNNDAPSFDLAKAGVDDTALALSASPTTALVNGDIDLKAGMNIRFGQTENGATSEVGNITVEAVTGDVSGLPIGSTKDGRLIADFGRGDLTAKMAGKTIKVTAIGASGNVQLGALKAGADKSTLDNKANDQINVTARTIDITSAEAVNGRLVLTAADRRLFLGTGSAGTFAELIKRNDDGATVDGEDLLRVDTISGGLRTDTDATILRGVSLRSAVDVNVTTGATAERGDLKINAGRDLSIVSGTTNTATATTGAILLAAGRDIVRANSVNAAEDLFGKAGRNATFGTVTATDNVTLEAVTGTLAITKVTTSGAGLNNLAPTFDLTKAGLDDAALTFVSRPVTPATDGDIELKAGTLLTVGDAKARPGNITGSAGEVGVGTADAGSAISLLAGSGNLTIGTGIAGSTIHLEKRGSLGAISIGSGGLTSKAQTLVESAGDIAVGGLVSAGGTAPQIVFRNTGGAGWDTAIGSAAGSGKFNLDQQEINRLNASEVMIDSGAQTVTLGTLPIDSDTGVAGLRFLTTGKVAVTGEVSGSGTGLLQIGGAPGAGNTLPAIPAGLITNEATLATQITADIGAGAGITFTNGVVDLRARRIVFGNNALLTRYLPQTGSGVADAQVVKDVSDPNSMLYTGNRSGRMFVTAKGLRISYSGYALFQNTTQKGAGIEINATGASTDPSLILFGKGDNLADSFAAFGSVNGLVLSAAAIPPVFFEGNPRINRVTQASSRVNGCVIGAPDRGCLDIGSPPPNFLIYDQRQTQLFGQAEDASLFFNPLVGRGNEGLIVDIADAPVGIDTIDCPPDDDTCKKPGADK